MDKNYLMKLGYLVYLSTEGVLNEAAYGDGLKTLKEMHSIYE
jgi:hypothetical protein